MGGVLDRKLLREVRSSGALLLAITSIIAVGVMCFVYMRSAYYNLSLARFRYYNQCRMADFWIELKKAPLVDVEPLLVVPRLEDAPPVEAIGVAPRSMSQQSHISITVAQYERAVDALASIAR